VRKVSMIGASTLQNKVGRKFLTILGMSSGLMSIVHSIYGGFEPNNLHGKRGGVGCLVVLQRCS
jgi:hypothetical protein